MLNSKPLNRILFIDIETTSLYQNYEQLPDNLKKIFEKRFKKEIESAILLKSSSKATNKKTDNNSQILEICNEIYDIKGPVYPEWGRILCISVGAIWKRPNEDHYSMHISSFADEDEHKLLSDFVKHEKIGEYINLMPQKYEKNPDGFWALCAFNGGIFDFPYISKRLIINGIQLPSMFDFASLKPWECSHLIDPKKEWQFNVFDSHVSLDHLAEIFGVESSKDDMDGSEVKDVYYVEKNLPRIVTYCEKDVLALARIYLKMKCDSTEVKLIETIAA